MQISNSPDGGIGRRARLKIWLSQGSAGSIPVLGTLITADQYGRLFLLVQHFLALRRFTTPITFLSITN